MTQGSFRSECLRSGVLQRAFNKEPQQPAGTVVGVVKAKEPGTEATPPLRVELAKVWPYEIVVAVGRVVISGVALETVTLTLVVTI